MKSFKEKCLNEAFNIFPTDSSHIDSHLPRMNDETREQAKELLDYIHSAINKKIIDPLAFSAGKNQSVKIIRDLMGKIDLKDLNQKFDKLSIQFGNGSRGNQGANNRGNLFEQEVVEDINLYLQEGLDAKFNYKELINKLHDELFSNYKDLNTRVIPEGEKNQKRSLVWSGNTPLINDSVVDIGNLITDISLAIESVDFKERKDIHFLSLKMGSTVTFANVGVRNLFKKKEMKENELNVKAESLLNVFGIDVERFLNIFNFYENPDELISDNKKAYIDTKPKYNKSMLVKFLSTGVGHNYWMIHQKKAGSQNIDVYYMDMNRLIHSVRPKKVIVKYPEIGKAKRIDVFVETTLYEFKINIRNKQGGVYPTHIMIDYKPIK